MGAGRGTGNGVQGSRQTGQEARGQRPQRPGQEMKRNKDDGISLGRKEGVGTIQEVRPSSHWALLSWLTRQVRQRATHTSQIELNN